MLFLHLKLHLNNHRCLSTVNYLNKEKKMKALSSWIHTIIEKWSQYARCQNCVKSGKVCGKRHLLLLPGFQLYKESVILRPSHFFLKSNTTKLSRSLIRPPKNKNKSWAKAIIYLHCRERAAFIQRRENSFFPERSVELFVFLWFGKRKSSGHLKNQITGV